MSEKNQKQEITSAQAVELLRKTYSPGISIKKDCDALLKKYRVLTARNQRPFKNSHSLYSSIKYAVEGTKRPQGSKVKTSAHVAMLEIGNVIAMNLSDETKLTVIRDLVKQ